jgi:ureidoglycolate hydrolase
MIERLVADFLAGNGGTLEELHALAKDETDVAYSDAWMFVTLFRCHVSKGWIVTKGWVSSEEGPDVRAHPLNPLAFKCSILLLVQATGVDRARIVSN